MWAVYAKIKNENAVDEKGVSKFSKAYDAIFKENDDNFFCAEIRTDVQALGSLGMQESNEKKRFEEAFLLRLHTIKNQAYIVFGGHLWWWSM